jgi:dTDP-4-dehydrorhamnose 3,5-epimerase
MKMHNRFSILPTSISGLHVLKRKPLVDDRGYLDRLFCLHELQEFSAGKSIIQINHTLTTRKGTVRGMHFQYPPAAETKIISCIRGVVFDVAVDIRRNSPFYLQWHGEILAANNHKTFVIPEGFAHGFQSLTNDCEMLYFHTAAYQPAAEDGLNAIDPRLAIQWPLPITGQSPRDLRHPMLSADFTGILL